jgi:MFS family permease
MLRWGVMAQTTDEIALALVQPSHGLTFALLHLACMRVIGDTVPRYLAATAQAIYGSAGIGGATALVTIISGWLYAYLGAAGAFWTMAGLCAAALPVISTLRGSLRPIMLGNIQVLIKHNEGLIPPFGRPGPARLTDPPWWALVLDLTAGDIYHQLGELGGITGAFRALVWHGSKNDHIDGECDHDRSEG